MMVLAFFLSGEKQPGHWEDLQGAKGKKDEMMKKKIIRKKVGLLVIWNQGTEFEPSKLVNSSKMKPFQKQTG